MKRQVQLPGVKKWSGGDLLDLQNEPLKVVDEFFSQWGDCVICGCEVTEQAIGAGLVSIGGYTLPLAASEITVFPAYLVADTEHIQREYADGVVRDIALRRFAKIVYSEPAAGTAFIEVTANGAPGFFDGIKRAPEYDHVYEEVEDVTDKNPSEEGWYEFDGVYELTEDTVPTIGKTYYIQKSYYVMTI